MSDALSSNQCAFADLPSRPVKPGIWLGTDATETEARQHFSTMCDYWIAEAKWQEARADQLNAELSAFLKVGSQHETKAPHPYLVNATRFKMSFDSKGRVNSFSGYEKQLDGVWVALVYANDDAHMAGYSPLKTEPPHE